MGIEGLTDPDEVLLLYQLCRLMPLSGKIVELGSYQGRSSVGLCQAAKEMSRDQDVVLVDNFSSIQKRGWQDKPNKREILEGNLAKLGYHPMIMDCDSVQAAGILDAMVAFIFIDSDHRPEHFNLEMNAWAGYLLPGAIVACHDYANPNCAGLGATIDFRMNTSTKVGLMKTTAAFRWEKVK